MIYSEIFDITNQAINLLNSKKENSLKNFGVLLNEYWYLKKQLDKNVYNDKIYYYCNHFLKICAFGAKLMWPCQSGFILILANRVVQSKIKKKFPNLKFIDIKGELDGSKIIYQK